MCFTQKSDGDGITTIPVYRPWRNGYLPICPDPASVCLMSDSAGPVFRFRLEDPTFKDFREHRHSVVVPN